MFQTAQVIQSFYIHKDTGKRDRTSKGYFYIRRKELRDNTHPGGHLAPEEITGQVNICLTFSRNSDATCLAFNSINRCFFF